MILQLAPPLPLVTPKGKGDAYFLSDEGQEHATLFLVGLYDSGEMWWFRQDDVRLQSNYTLHRAAPALKPETTSGP